MESSRKEFSFVSFVSFRNLRLARFPPRRRPRVLHEEKQEGPALFSFSHPQPRQIVKPNDFPAVPLPKPGSSYNPDAEQHQDLIGEQLVQEKHYSDMMKKERTLMNGMTKADLFSQRIPANVLSVGRGIGF